jgi:hypothetical protein
VFGNTLIINWLKLKKVSVVPTAMMQPTSELKEVLNWPPIFGASFFEDQYGVHFYAA